MFHKHNSTSNPLSLIFPHQRYFILFKFKVTLELHQSVFSFDCFYQSFSLLSVCSVPQSLCSLSGLLLEALFSLSLSLIFYLCFSTSVSPPPCNSAFTPLLRAHAQFLPLRSVSMYSLSVHLHTTHYVTSFSSPSLFPYFVFTPTHYEPRKEHTE